MLRLTIYLLNILILAHAKKNLLKKIKLQDPTAVCNDGSQGIYYIQHDPMHTKWILFLEGGGACSSSAECEERSKTKPYFTSSRSYPETIEGRNLFDDVYFNDHNKVLLVYCSSDFWLGNYIENEPILRDSISENHKLSVTSASVTIPDIYDNETATNKLNETKSIVPNESESNNILNVTNSYVSNKTVVNEFFSIKPPENNDSFDDNITKSSISGFSNENFKITSTKLIPVINMSYVDLNNTRVTANERKALHFDSGAASHSNDKNFFFRGVNIFKSVVCDLMRNGLNSSSTILLAGSSAGGIGAINHADYLKKKTNVTVFVMIDSSWLINYNNVLNNLNYSGIMKTKGCHDFSLGFPCCLSTSCMITQQYISPSIHILAIVSKYDVYSVFPDKKFDNTRTLFEVLTEFQAYGGQLTYSISLIEAYKSVSYLVTTCMQHVYLATSDLWKNVYNSKTEENFQGLKFKHIVDPVNFRLTQINGNSAEDLFLFWYKEVSNNSSSGVTENFKLPLRRIDPCKRLQCNTSSCPIILFPENYIEQTSNWQRTLLITVILTIVIVAYCIKLSWMYHNWKLKKTQSIHLAANKDSTKEESSTCLPPCPPHSSIGISCSKLTYNITSATQTESDPRNRNGIKIQKPFTKLRRKSALDAGRKIIKGVSAYFNPGQLVAIMGPSGSGKTTLLDVLTARKNFKEAEKHIFINGLPADETREWFIKNSGYVLQLATPYHEQLTVRQNLTYSAMLRLPSKMKLKEKMWRVEQILGQTGLFNVADVVVGGNTSKGSGLSGGQKRRLCVGLQLVDLPSVIFLDEPTSGLDSASSLELLEMLHGLTLSGRLVVVTIHQPRIEIFHMFDTILFLCDGQAAYFGSPLMAPTMIAEALQGSGKIADSSNPADTIMDVLNNTELQCIIVDHYNHSGEIEGINRAIARAKRHPQKTLSMKFQKQTSSISDRLIALDGRSSSSQTFAQKLYFPLIFMLFALALGTCYFKTKKAVLLMSCYMVFLCASQLFMSSVIHAHLNKAFALFSLEKADGIGFSHELVLHAFIRIFSQSSISLLGACVIIYLCVLKVYDTEKFFLTSVIHLQLNQVWIALIICIACLTPNYSHLVTPIASAIAGFAGGFLVPEPQMPIFYYWLFYINPTHWAYCGTMFVLMRNMTDCKNETIIECQQNTGAMTLKDFGLHKSNPYRSMLVLLAMLVSLLTMSVVVLEITHAKKKWKKVLGNSLKSIKLNCVSYYQSFRDHLNEKKKKRKEAERQRLFELAEQKYTYKSPLTSNDTSFVEVCNGDVLIGNDEKIKKETASVDDVLEETEDSSNDEDHYDYVTQNFLDVQKEPKSRLNGSFTSFFSKIQHFNRSGNSSEDKTEMKVKVHFRRKNQKKTKGDKFKDRRKTFSGVITEHSNQQDKPSKRPASVSGEPFRSERNSQMGSPFEKLKYFNNDFQKLSSSKEALKLERQCLDMPQSENERGNEFQKTLQLISHGCLLHDKEAKTKNDQNNVYPPDIVIDIDQNLEAERRIHSTKTEENKRPKQKKKKRDTRNESKSIDTWSKYLDTASRRHEVYCALSSVKRRLKSSKRGSEHVERESIIKKDEILQRTASFIKKDGTLQRKTSLLILREKQMSMRSQLQEFQQQLSQDGSISPVAEKQMQLIRTRNKYRRLPHNSNEDENTVDETISQEAVKSSRREFIERLSLLSSGRSSNVSNLCESNRNTYDGSRTSYEANATVDKEPNTNIYEDTVYEDFEDHSRRPYSLYSNEIKYRENDPLLPDERALVEGLLNKYAHLETSIRDRASCLQEHPSVPSRLTFSSGVKIKGLSPNHSRKTSRVERNSSSSFNRDQNSEALAMSKLDEEDDETKQQGHNLNNNDNNTLNGEGLVNSDDNVFTKNDSEKSQIKSFSTSSVSRTSDVTSPISNRKQMSTLQVKPLIVNKETEKSRKISITVKSVARVEKPTEIFDNENSSNPTSSDYEDEDPDNQIESPRITESQQEEMLRMYKKENFFKDRNEKTKKKKKRESLAPETDYDSGSTSSDYEENFVKTEEGFIIPDDTISKVIASSTMGAPNTRLGRRRGSQNQQSEIEKMFKKDNYLKDRSNKRGIRMPIGSAGKVNQLLSKFENNKNMKANLTSNRTRRSLEKLNEKNATQRPFFKVLKTPKPNAPSNTQTQRPIYSSSSSDEEEKVEASRSSLKQKRPRKISEHLENINE